MAKVRIYTTAQDGKTELISSIDTATGAFIDHAPYRSSEDLRKHAAERAKLAFEDAAKQDPDTVLLLCSRHEEDKAQGSSCEKPP